jgi:hypothetical protein
MRTKQLAPNRQRPSDDDLVSNLTETCLTAIGDAQLPFNMMNTQLCSNDLTSQRWFFLDPVTGTMCTALNGYYLLCALR